MKVCVIGGGGREHTLAWKLAQSDSVTKVYAIPGSKAMEDVAECVAIDWQDFAAVTKFLQKEAIDLVVIGPEAPLVAGLADAVRAAGIAVFGPSKAAAQLEGSKVFAKDLMKNTTFRLLLTVYLMMRPKQKLSSMKPGHLSLLKRTVWLPARV